MMIVRTGVIEFTKDSEELKEFNMLCSSLNAMDDDQLRGYKNELLSRGTRSSIQLMKVYAIDYILGNIEMELI